MNKIYILTTIELSSDGELSFDVEKFGFGNRFKAEERGHERLAEWVEEHAFEDEDGNLIGPSITEFPNLVEAKDRESIAEFDYLISEFEV
jgi:hypothetical protein